MPCHRRFWTWDERTQHCKRNMTLRLPLTENTSSNTLLCYRPLFAFCFFCFFTEYPSAIALAFAFPARFQRGEKEGGCAFEAIGRLSSTENVDPKPMRNPFARGKAWHKQNGLCALSFQLRRPVHPWPIFCILQLLLSLFFFLSSYPIVKQPFLSSLFQITPT